MWQKCRDLPFIFKNSRLVVAEINSAESYNSDRTVRCSSTLSRAEIIRRSSEEARPFNEVPHPKGIPLIGDIVQLFKSDKSHILAQRNFEKYGSIYRQQLGNFRLVLLADVAAIEKMYRNDGKLPRRVIPPPWTHWREQQKLPTGLITVNDVGTWRRMRRVIDRPLMQPPHVALYTDKINEVITDFMSHIKNIRSEEGLVENADRVLLGYVMEVIGAVMFESRLGALNQKDVGTEVNMFLESTRHLLKLTHKLIWFPPAVAKFIVPKTYRAFDEAWHTLFRTANRAINDRSLRHTASKEQNDRFLDCLLKSKALEPGEIQSNMAELMLAGVDTSSSVMQFLIHELARHPDIQEELHREVSAVCPNDVIPSYQDIQKMPLVKAVVKEVARLYPPAMPSRVLEEDITLCGFNIPAGTMVFHHAWAVGRDPANFSDPDDFRPHRWLRDSFRQKNNPYAFLAFAHGPRMCIGKRVSDLSMGLLVARMVKTFHLYTPNTNPLETTCSSLIIPKAPPVVHFKDREC